MKRFYTASIVQQSYANSSSFKTHLISEWCEDVKVLEFKLQEIAKEKDDNYYHTVNIVFMDLTKEVERGYAAIN